MSTIAVLVSAAMGAASAPGPSLPDPIAPASAGQLQCYAPDKARKTCASLAAYRAVGDGKIDNVAIVLISKNPPITMQTVTPVEVKDGQVCGAIRGQDIDSATFRIGDTPLDATRTAQLRVQLQSSLKGVVGHAICTAYTPQGDSLATKVTIDGKPQPAMDQTVIWVSPDQGYTVGP